MTEHGKNTTRRPREGGDPYPPCARLTHDCCNVSFQSKILGVWLPAFAGTTLLLQRLLGRLRCRKNKAVGRRQVEPRLDSQKRRDSRDHLAPGRNRIPARGDETVGFGQRL